MSASSFSRSKISVAILPAPHCGWISSPSRPASAAGRGGVAQVRVAHLDAQLRRRGASRPLAQRHAAIRRRQRNLVLAERDLIGADGLARDRREHLLGHRHQLAVLAVGLVELEHRELGVVLGRNPLVPEVAVDLVDALEAADGQPLEIQLRRDAQEQLHVERVVMRHERPRQRAAGDRLHHRRLDLEIAAGVQERADRRQHPAAHLEHLARIGIDDQIEIALAVAGLDVGQAVPLLGQREEALGQELERRRPDRQLVGLGAEQAALDADEVAEVEQLEHREVALGQRVLPDVDLDLRAAVREDQEVRLAEAANRQDAAGGAGARLLGLELLAGLRRVRLDQRRRWCRCARTPRVRIDPEADQLLEILPPLAQLVGFTKMFVGHVCR